MYAVKTIIVFSIIILFLPILSNAEEYGIPDWIKNNAKWWAEGQIDDDTFVSGIQFLIKEDIVIIPPTANALSSRSGIPDWIKNNAGWWADGKISDGDFIAGIQFLVQNNIIHVKSNIILPIPSQPESNYLDNGCTVGYPYIWSDGLCYDQPEPYDELPEQVTHLTGRWQGVANWSASFDYYDGNLGFYRETCNYSGDMVLQLQLIDNSVTGSVQVPSYSVTSATTPEACQAGFTLAGAVDATVFGSGFSGTVGVLDIDGQFTTDLLRGQVSGSIGGVDISGEFTASRSN